MPRNVPDFETDRPTTPTPEVHSPPASVRRGMGWIQDTPDARDRTAHALLGALRNLPPEATLEMFVRRIRNQHEMSCCVGMAIAMAIDIRLKRMGYTTPEPAPLPIYASARELGLADENDPLIDEGSSPRLAMKGVRELGVMAEADFPLDASNVNEKLMWGHRQKASQFRITAWYRITSEGMSRVADICNAIAQGYPVVFAAQIDQPFTVHTGRENVSVYNPALHRGGHYMCIVGYKTVNGRVIFRIANSWGEAWGDFGYYYAEDTWIAADTINDVYVIQVALGDAKPTPTNDATKKGAA